MIILYKLIYNDIYKIKTILCYKIKMIIKFYRLV